MPVQKVPVPTAGGMRSEPSNRTSEAAATRSRSRRVVASGEFYFVQTVLRGRIWLRTALMNPFTSPAHLDALLDAVERAAP